MPDFAHTVNDMITQLDFIQHANVSDDTFKVMIVDLLVTAASFSITKWAETSPQDAAVGILLLNVQMQCLQYLEDKQLSIPYPIQEKDMTP